ncbi:E3 ubiquitin-protein ligase RNF186 [Pelobates fuscus]|uniref:E3 ubiquitin-protein ligase RNF186 n=1 Tax=Pelobates fuscus TaxID=191477 RepID=UPI002FE47F8C
MDSHRTTGESLESAAYLGPCTEEGANKHVLHTETTKSDTTTISAQAVLPVGKDNQSYSAAPMPRQDSLNSPSSPLSEMDCPVCFSKYDIYRIPKRLACNHNFCAVCLKLLIRNETGSWIITCPICRASTSVFGGLICTLENQESLMNRLENQETQAKSGGPSQRSKVSCQLDMDSHLGSIDESSGNLRIAARRVVSLCLILLIVLIIILQFVYGGIIKWVLGFVLGVVVIIAVLLCLNPNCKVKLTSSTDNIQKDNYANSSV